jgi:hypothetical protein
MAFDGTGRLIVTDVGNGTGMERVWVSSGGPLTQLFTLPSPAFGVAVDSADRIFTSAFDGTIRIHNSSGGLVDVELPRFSGVV